MSDFQVSAWPAEAYEHESAYGFFQRLAHMNGQSSVRPFAAMLGLNVRNPHFEELLKFCLKLPSRGKEHLVRATPQIDGSVVKVEGHTLRNGNQWTWYKPRVCPGCIHDAPYYRNWFDIQAIAVCPIHNATLTSGIGEDRLRPFQSLVGSLPRSGESLARRHTRIDPPDSFDRYLLGRLGALPKLPCSELDSLGLSDVIDFTEVLGLVSQVGWQLSLPRRWRSPAERHASCELGFRKIADGDGDLRASLRGYALEAPIERHRSSAIADVTKFCGWLGKIDRNRGQWQGRIRAALLDLARERGVYRRSEYSISKQRAALFSVLDIAQLNKCRKRVVKDISIRLGYETSGHKARFYFDQDAAERLAEAIRTLVPRHKIPFVLGVAPRKLDRLLHENGLKPVVQAKAAYVDQFLAAEVIELERKLDCKTPRLPAKWRWNPTCIDYNHTNKVFLSGDEWDILEPTVTDGCGTLNRSVMRDVIDNILTLHRNGLNWGDVITESPRRRQIYSCWAKMNASGKWDKIIQQIYLRPDLFA